MVAKSYPLRKGDKVVDRRFKDKHLKERYNIPGTVLRVESEGFTVQWEDASEESGPYKMGYAWEFLDPNCSQPGIQKKED